MRMLTETDAPMCYSLFETPIGQVGVAWSGRGLTRLQLPEASASATERRLRGRSHTAAPASPRLRCGARSRASRNIWRARKPISPSSNWT